MMRMDDPSFDPANPNSAEESQGPPQDPSSGPAAAPEGKRAERGDRVEISEQGRALAAEAPQVAESEDTDVLSPQRLDVIRQKLQDGGYDRPEVVDHVARKLIERGEVYGSGEAELSETNNGRVAVLQDSEALLRLLECALAETQQNPSGDAGSLAAQTSDQTSPIRAAALVSMRDVLRRAYSEIGALMHDLGTRQRNLRQAANDSISVTHRKLAEIAGSAEMVGRELREGLSRTLTLIDSLEGRSDPESVGATAAELKQELGRLLNLLTVQELMSKQLDGTSRMLAGVERRVNALADLLD